jgi:hypothetical protein
MTSPASSPGSLVCFALLTHVPSHSHTFPASSPTLSSMHEVATVKLEPLSLPFALPVVLLLFLPLAVTTR